jgi:hypothetical protein
MMTGDMPQKQSVKQPVNYDAMIDAEDLSDQTPMPKDL